MIRIIATLLFAAAASCAAAAPARVVSMNLCTDQLAMLIASPGQLVSVSALSQDPVMSAMVDEAKTYKANQGRAEEVFIMRPDLVLAGAFTARSTVAMLKRLGFRVEVFQPSQNFADIHTNIKRMGVLLGHEDRASKLLVSFDRELAKFASDSSGPNAPLAAAYYPGGRTSGKKTLMNGIMEAAGWRNFGAELGITGIGNMPLELLVMNRPDAVINAENDALGPVLANENFRHPALLGAIKSGMGLFTIPNRFELCGGPFTIEAVRALDGLRQKISVPVGRSQ